MSIIIWIIATGPTKLAAYNGLNVKIEQICKWLCLAIVVSVSLILLFPLIYTGVAYYMLNFGVDSFYLYPPITFVSIWI